jgi:hypothetical protein
MTAEDQEYLVYSNLEKSSRCYTTTLKLSEEARVKLESLVQSSQPMATVGSLRISQTGGVFKLNGEGEMPISVIDIARNNTEIYSGNVEKKEGEAIPLVRIGILRKRLTVKERAPAPIAKPKKVATQGAQTVLQRKRMLGKAGSSAGKRHKPQKPVDSATKQRVSEMNKVILGYLALAGQEGVAIATLRKQVQNCTAVLDGYFLHEVEKFANPGTNGVYVGKTKFIGQLKYNRHAKLCKFDVGKLEMVKRNVEHVKAKGCFPDIPSSSRAVSLKTPGSKLDPIYLKKYSKIQNHQQYLDLKASYMQKTQMYNTLVKELNVIKGKISLKKALLGKIKGQDRKAALAKDINQLITEKGDEIKRKWKSALDLQKERDVLLNLVNTYCSEYHKRTSSSSIPAN